MSAAPLAVEVEQLGRTYGSRLKTKGLGKNKAQPRVALSDISLQVRPGELFGLLGPNGAGKTTLIKILTTLLAPSSGWARVTGFDVARWPHLVRPRINMVSGGEASGYGLLTVRENLWMFAQFYGLGYAEASRRISDLLAIVNMSDRINTKSSELSTGLRQKMNIVRGFLTDPAVLFLDEPTLGLDVGASRDVRAFVRRWVNEDRHRTVLLTTHYMVEADELCDRVAIINGGRVLACDTPAALKRRLQSEPIFHLETTMLGGSGADVFRAVPGVSHVTHREGDGRSTVELVLRREDVLSGVMSAMERHRVGLMNLTKREPTLEDVFVDLVGKSMADVEKGNGP